MSQKLLVQNPTQQTICSIQVKRVYRSGFDEVLHVNLDKALPPGHEIEALTDLPHEGGVVERMVVLSQRPCED